MIGDMKVPKKAVSMTATFTFEEIVEVLVQQCSDEDIIAIFKEYEVCRAEWGTAISMFNSFAELILKGADEILEDLQEGDGVSIPVPPVEGEEVFLDNPHTLVVNVKKLYARLVLQESTEEDEYEALERHTLRQKSSDV